MELFFDDLTQDAQEALLQYAGINAPEDANWDVVPVAVIELQTTL